LNGIQEVASSILAISTR